MAPPASNARIPTLDFGLGEEIDMLRDSVRGFSSLHQIFNHW